MAGVGRLGQVGLGSVGRHFASHLLRLAGALTVHDKDPERVRVLAQEGAAAAGSARAVASASDVVVLSLPDPGTCRSVMLGADGVLAGAARGALVIDTSTIDPRTSRELHEAARERGIQYLDAPVTTSRPGGGGSEGAKAASVTFLVGGDADAFARARPVLERLSYRAFHLGPPGSGSIVKLVTNHISGIFNLAVAEGLALAAAAGITAERMIEVTEDSVAKCYILSELIAPRLRSRDFSPGFSIDLMHKDHRLAGELARELNVPVLLNQVALELYQMMRSAGRGGRDHVDAVNFAAEMAGVDLHAPRPGPRVGPAET